MRNSMKGEADMDHQASEERAQLQLERLQTTLNRAWRNVPFHRNRWNEVARFTGGEPPMLEEAGDIAALPFMERSYNFV